MSTPSEIEKHLEVLKGILKFTAPLEEHEKATLTFFIGVGERMDEQFFIDILSNHKYWCPSKTQERKRQSQAILNELGGREYGK